MAIKGEKAACGGCAYFPLQDALAAGGFARCPIYGKARGYDWPATVLYVQAKDIVQRRTMVKNFLATKQPENLNNEH